MSLFLSKRERYLWISTLTVLISIYSSLGLAGLMAEGLQNRGWVEIFFAIFAFLTLIVFITQGLKVRPGGVEIAVGLGMMITFSMVIIRMGIPVLERTHLIEYGLLATFIFQALVEGAQNGRNVPLLPVVTILVTSIFGIIDELILAILPNRIFDIRDVFFNVLSAIIAVGFSLLMTRIQKWLNITFRNKV